MQEEFSCQVMQGIGQSCNYIVYAIRCGDSQNGVMSESVGVHVPGMIQRNIMCSLVLLTIGV